MKHNQNKYRYDGNRTGKHLSTHFVQFSSGQVISYTTFDARGYLVWTLLGNIFFLRSSYSKFRWLLVLVRRQLFKGGYSTFRWLYWVLSRSSPHSL